MQETKEEKIREEDRLEVGRMIWCRVLARETLRFDTLGPDYAATAVTHVAVAFYNAGVGRKGYPEKYIMVDKEL